MSRNGLPRFLLVSWVLLAVGCGGGGGDAADEETGAEETGAEETGGEETGAEETGVTQFLSGKLVAGDCLGCPLLVVDLQSGTEMPLTEDVAGDAAWSPSGTRIAFMGSGQLHVIDEDGTEQQMLAEQGFYPAWAPDEESIAIAQYDVSGLPQIAEVNLETGEVSVLALGGTRPSYHPDGTRLAFSRPATEDLLGSFMDHDIHVMDRATGETTLLTKGLQPMWSPDGQTLAFIRLDPDNVVDVASETDWGPGMGVGFDILLWDEATGSEEKVLASEISFAMYHFGSADVIHGWVGGSRNLLFTEVSTEEGSEGMSSVHLDVRLLDTVSGESLEAGTSLLNPSWHASPAQFME